MSAISKEKILSELEKARNELEKDLNAVRILFSPLQVTEHNLPYLCRALCHVRPDDYDSVIVVESQVGSHSRKLPMPSPSVIEAPFGNLEVNDKLRNELCDEDDDFFIDDEAFGDHLSLYPQLGLMQCVLDDFNVLSLQITEESSFIVKELAYALEEILASRNTFLIFCCDLNRAALNEFENIMKDFESQNFSGLMNKLSSESDTIQGFGSLFAGLLISDKWGMKVHLETDEENHIMAAFSEVQRQPVFG